MHEGSKGWNALRQQVLESNPPCGICGRLACDIRLKDDSLEASLGSVICVCFICEAEMGKGSKRRPQQAADTDVSDNWERIFGKDKRVQQLCEAPEMDSGQGEQSVEGEPCRKI